MSRVEVGGVLAFAALIVVACGPGELPSTSLVPAEAAPAPTPLLSWYLDADGDGHGDRQTTLTAIDPPSGYVTSRDDCNDHDPAIHPGASEIAADGVDNNCNGKIDEVVAQAPAAPSPAPGN